MKAILKIFAASAVTLAIAVLAFAGEDAPANGGADAITPSEALADSKAENGAVVKVVGTLENAGTNYFTDRRLVLKEVDGEGEINVQAWLPMTAQPSTDPGKRREVMSDYLGKKVILTGKVTQQPVKGVGVTEVLVVKAAHVRQK